MPLPSPGQRVQCSSGQQKFFRNSLFNMLQQMRFFMSPADGSVKVSLLAGNC